MKKELSLIFIVVAFLLCTEVRASDNTDLTGSDLVGYENLIEISDLLTIESSSAEVLKTLETEMNSLNTKTK